MKQYGHGITSKAKVKQTNERVSTITGEMLQ